MQYLEPVETVYFLDADYQKREEIYRVTQSVTKSRNKLRRHYFTSPVDQTVKVRSDFAKKSGERL